MLSSAVRELSDILEHMGPSPGCKKCSGGSEGAAKVEFQLHSTNESYDKLVILARQSEARLRSKEEEVLELQSKVKLNGSQIIIAIHPNSYEMISAFDHGCSIKGHRGGEGHPQAGLGGVRPRQGRGHQEGMGDEGHGREEKERLRGGARQRADSSDAGENMKYYSESFSTPCFPFHSPLPPSATSFS